MSEDELPLHVRRAARTPARFVATRAYVADAYAMLVAIAVVLLGVFLPVVLVPYAFSDDYPVLAMATGLGSSPWFGSTLIDSSSINGRPLPGAPGPVSTRYRVESYPTFYVLAPNGRIVWRSDGEQPDALLRHELELAGVRLPD